MSFASVCGRFGSVLFRGGAGTSGVFGRTGDGLSGIQSRLSDVSGVNGNSLWGGLTNGCVMGSGMWLNQVRGMKVVSALHRRCPSCRITKKGKRLYVRCEAHPRHKQRQGGKNARYSN